MKAVFLIKNGKASTAFEMRDIPTPVAGAGQVLIKVEAFGLNFADVMARNGMYKEAPPIPCVLGYDVAGVVTEVGPSVTNVKPGDTVTAMTRFGGYAQYAVTDARATSKIPAHMDMATATALTTQFCTAYFAAAEMVNLHPGDKVLVQSGAGGVGTALIQFAKYKQCEIFSTAGTKEKLQYLKASGVQHPINYTTHDFEKEIKTITGGKGVDVIFDAVGGKSVKKGFRSLASGGRIVCYGAADMSDKNIFGKVKAALDFGIYHPVMFMMASKAMIGVNMLRVADDRPDMLQRCLEAVTSLAEKGVFAPTIGKIFPVAEIAIAHEFLETRKSMGKVVMKWQE
ncbi:MAG: L-threonine 3-dehydrogenase [Ferruginibacter sp.]|nr:L-threonine 3-dehydrogenase [Ferruginibacter sp.]